MSFQGQGGTKQECHASSTSALMGQVRADTSETEYWPFGGIINWWCQVPHVYIQIP